MTVSPELDARFRDAAAAESLLDVAYELHDTPVGRLLIAVTDHGVCEIHYDADPEAEAERLARFFGTSAEMWTGLQADSVPSHHSDL